MTKSVSGLAELAMKAETEEQFGALAKSLVGGALGDEDIETFRAISFVEQIKQKEDFPPFRIVILRSMASFLPKESSTKQELLIGAREAEKQVEFQRVSTNNALRQALLNRAQNKACPS